MSKAMRLFALVAGTSFLVAGVIHPSMFISGYEPQQAFIAESSIAIMLLVAFGLTWIWPAQRRDGSGASGRKQGKEHDHAAAVRTS
jgi:hypothetical protein